MYRLHSLRVFIFLIAIFSISIGIAHAEKPIKCKSAEACLQRGQNLFDGRGTKMDIPKARRHLSASCEMDYAEGCFALGLSYSDMLDNKADSIPHFQRACDLGHLGGCNNAAAMLSKSGTMTAEQTVKALATYTTLCDNDIAIGCLNLGSHFYTEDASPEDQQKGLKYLHKGYDLNGSSQPLNLPAPDSTGEIRPAAMQYLKNIDAECDRLPKSGSCLHAAKLHFKGDGVPKNPERALEILERGCNLDSKQACYEVGAKLSSGKFVEADEPRAYVYFQRACDLGKAFACLDIADMIEAGVNLPAEVLSASHYVARACELGDRESC